MTTHAVLKQATSLCGWLWPNDGLMLQGFYQGWHSSDQAAVGNHARAQPGREKPPGPAGQRGQLLSAGQAEVKSYSGATAPRLCGSGQQTWECPSCGFVLSPGKTAPCRPFQGETHSNFLDNSGSNPLSALIPII